MVHHLRTQFNFEHGFRSMSDNQSIFLSKRAYAEYTARTTNCFRLYLRIYRILYDYIEKERSPSKSLALFG